MTGEKSAPGPPQPNPRRVLFCASCSSACVKTLTMLVGCVGSLLIQDAIQYAMHVGEHSISPWLYKNSHKPHHHFTNPRLFDAFDVTTSTVPHNPKHVA